MPPSITAGSPGNASRLELRSGWVDVALHGHAGIDGHERRWQLPHAERAPAYEVAQMRMIRRSHGARSLVVQPSSAHDSTSRNIAAGSSG